MIGRESSGLETSRLAPQRPWAEKLVTLLAIAAGATGGALAETQLGAFSAAVEAAGLSDSYDPAVQAPPRKPDNISGTPEAAPKALPPATEEIPAVSECVAELPLKIRVGQLIMAGVNGDNLEKARPIFRRHKIGGAVIMSPADSLDAASISKFKNSQKIPLLLATDEEGGEVQRFTSLGVLPSAQEMASTKTPGEARKTIADHGSKLNTLGIDMVFGPVADVGPLEGIGPMKDRVFSSKPDVVSNYAMAYAKGWQDAGIIPVMKHFPGHGAASADTHINRAVTPSPDQLRPWDWLPYKALQPEKGIGVMTGHLIVPEMGGSPASINKEVVTGMLRDELGYKENLVISDSLTMGGVGLPVPKAAERAIAAGNDIALSVGIQDASSMDRELTTVQNQIQKAVDEGRITEDQINKSVLRVLEAKGVDTCPQY